MTPGPEPAIVGAVVASLRQVLLDRGLWRDVLALAKTKHGLEDPAPLEAAAGTIWVDLDVYVPMLDAMLELLGEDGVREIGEVRVDGEVEGGFFSTILRSWIRSFAGKPDEIVRIGPHLWRAALRNAGTMQVAAAGDGFMRLRIHAPAPHLLASRAWQILLEGIGRGLFEALGMQGDVHCARAPGDALAVDCLLMWDS